MHLLWDMPCVCFFELQRFPQRMFGDGVDGWVIMMEFISLPQATQHGGPQHHTAHSVSAKNAATPSVAVQPFMNLMQHTKHGTIFMRLARFPIPSAITACTPALPSLMAIFVGQVISHSSGMVCFASGQAPVWLPNHCSIRVITHALAQASGAQIQNQLL